MFQRLDLSRSARKKNRVHALALRLSCKQLIPILANYALFSVLLIVLVKFVTSEQSWALG